MKFCDTHIHLLAPEWGHPVLKRVESARQNRIGLLLQPGVRVTDWPELLTLAEQNPEVYLAPGVHPLAAETWSERCAADLQKLCAQSKVLAIGEVGLDAALDVDLKLQHRVFTAQVKLACEAGLPLLIHCRRRTAEVLEVLQEYAARLHGGIWHGFSGSSESAQQIIAQGFALGIGPVLLRKNARKLPEALKGVPDSMLVLETDAPDMATGPETLITVARRLAELRGWTLKECARVTTENAHRILKLGVKSGE